jgi:cytochrome c oxidase assembly protein subunit 15
LVWKKALTKPMIKPLLILFLLGALQGAVGWIMVKSGLVGNAIYVQPAKLALHFIFALGLIGYAFWFALQLTVSKNNLVESSVIRRLTWLILIVLFFQLLFGAVLAGNKAAAAAPTWPTINGDWIPHSMFSNTPSSINFINNKIAIHFVHRGLAYLLFLLILVWFSKAASVSSSSSYFLKGRWLPLIMVILQIILGILAVLNSPSIVANHWGVFDWIAQFHQLTALLLFLTILFMLFVVRSPRSQAEM